MYWPKESIAHAASQLNATVLWISHTKVSLRQFTVPPKLSDRSQIFQLKLE